MKETTYIKRTNVHNLVLDDKFKKVHNDGKIYICVTCDSSLKKNKIPVQSQANGLQLDNIPEELNSLTEIEQRLISQRILFMQIRELPSGMQKGVRGPAVNIPANLGPICTVLPRIPINSHIIPLKFKRRLSYKSAYIYDSVHVQRVTKAMFYLQRNNPLYKDKVDFRYNWVNDWKESEDMYNSLFYDALISENNTENEINSSLISENDNQMDVISNLYENNNLYNVAKRNGFKLFDVPGDGSCMFHAVSHQLCLLNIIQTNAVEMRKDVCDYMCQNANIYKGFIAINEGLRNEDMGVQSIEDVHIASCDNICDRDNMLWNNFIKKQRENDYGNHITLKAISDKYGIDINILQPQNDAYRGYETIIKANNRENVKTIYLGFQPQIHYMSLVPIQINNNTERIENNTETIIDGIENNINGIDENIYEIEEDDNAYDESCQLRGIPRSTLLQNEMIPTEYNKNTIYCIAPGEGKKPVPLITDNKCEELAFPHLFPNGKGGFHSKRQVPITYRKYVNARLFNCDGRFAKDINYILAMQYAIEHANVNSAINIAMRHINSDMLGGGRVTAGLLRRQSFVNKMIKSDLAYRFLKNVRGSPPYWQTMFYEALAMIRTLGTPTFFLTLSAADLRWPEVIQTIGKQYGYEFSKKDVKEMSWRNKCKWINQNPVTVARMFQDRVETFLSRFLRSRSNPIGYITDHIIRVEFQARGSPHIHSIFWIKDAPKLGINSDMEVIDFIDKNVSCSIPNEDTELSNLVTSLQVHSHSSSCRRRSKCRFHYPRPPIDKTIISTECNNDEEKLNNAQLLLSKVYSIINNNDSEMDIKTLLEKASVTMDDYISAISTNRRGRSVILKRDLKEKNVNCYSPCILRAWQANMDFQFIVDAYACLMYVASYVLKAEKGMSQLLKQAAREVENESIRQQLSRIGSVFLTNREVSAQEAIYRANGMPLRMCSRSTVFTNTNVPEKRIGIMLPSNILERKDDDDEDVRSKNMIDRYIVRPDTVETLCLADFCTCYVRRQESDCESINDDGTDTNINQYENCDDFFDIMLLPKKLQLKENNGIVYRRNRQCILRWPGFNLHKDPEKYFRSRLMLFTHWRIENNLLGGYMNYRDKYKDEIESIQIIEKR